MSGSNGLVICADKHLPMNGSLRAADRSEVFRGPRRQACAEVNRTRFFRFRTRPPRRTGASPGPSSREKLSAAPPSASPRERARGFARLVREQGGGRPANGSEAGAPLPRSTPHVGKRQDGRDGRLTCGISVRRKAQNMERSDGVTSTSDATRSRSRASPGPKATNGTGLRVCPRSPRSSMLPWSEVRTTVMPAADV